MKRDFMIQFIIIVYSKFFILVVSRNIKVEIKKQTKTNEINHESKYSILHY